MGREPIGMPVGHRLRRGGEVDHRRLPAGLAADVGEVADDHQLGPRRVGLHGVDAGDRGPVAGLGHRDDEVRVEGTAVGVDRGEAVAHDVVDPAEASGDVELAVAQHHVLHPAVGLGGEGGDPLAVAEVELGQLRRSDRVDVVEGAAGDDVPVGGRHQRVDVAVDVGGEVGVDHPGGGVEGEDPVAGDVGAVGGLPHLGERAADDHLVADLDDGVDPAIHGVRGEVHRVGVDHNRVLGVGRACGQREAAGQQTADDQCQNNRACAIEPRVSS